jgi:hypothetical protein
MLNVIQKEPSTSDFSHPLYFEYPRTTSDIGSPTQNIGIAKPVATALGE